MHFRSNFLGWMAAGFLSLGSASAATYSVSSSSSVTGTYSALGPSFPAQPTTPFANLPMPLPTIAAFNSSLGTLTSAQTRLDIYYTLDMRSVWNALYVAPDDLEARMDIYTDIDVTGLRPSFHNFHNSVLARCNASALGAFNCNKSDFTGFYWDYYVGSPPLPYADPLQVSMKFTTLLGSGGGGYATLNSLNVDINFTLVATTTYTYQPQVAAVPTPAAAWLFGSALGVVGWMRRRTH